MIENHEDSDLKLYAALIVNEAGERDTMSLAPDRHDCPKQAQAELAVKAKSSLDLAAPTESFADGECTPTPLAPGRYVVRVGSGYNSIYAAATIELPLTGPVRLELLNHSDEAVVCDPIKARRAARLGFSAVKRIPGLGKSFLDGCDASNAICGSLPLPEGPPPAKCSVTLHENLLVVARPAGDDAIHGFTAWADSPVSFINKPQVTSSSASRIIIEGRDVVIEGADQRHMHTHGGAASRIGGMQLRVHNPLSRTLSYSVKAVEWLTDSDCGLPRSVTKRPRPRGATQGILPSGDSELDINFATQEAYQSYCDRFASRAVLQVDGKRVAVTVEHRVTRVEPMRR